MVCQINLKISKKSIYFSFILIYNNNKYVEKGRRDTMGNCPFLSTNDKEELCFKECSFYDEKNEDTCPFKNLKGNVKIDLNKFARYDLDEDIDMLEACGDIDKEFPETEYTEDKEEETY